MSYPPITQAMVESHCDILWAKNLEACLGRHATEDYGTAPDEPAKQAIISEQRLMSNIIVLWIKNLLTTDAKCKLSTFRTAYTFNKQDDVASMFFVIIKMVLPETCPGLLDMKSKLDTINMSQFKHNLPRGKLHIVKRMNKISINADNYSEILM